MTNDEMRSAVAEEMGWRQFQNADGDLCEGHLTRTWTEWHGPTGELACEPPNFPADLNACHEMEKHLTPEEEVRYVDMLGHLIMQAAYEDDPRWLNSELASSDSTYRATAPQRCEAFLRVRGKWRDA